MSTSPSETVDRVIENFNGGLPTSRDLVPSIIFTVALGLTLPMLIYRLSSRKHRSRILGNAVMFFILRTAAMIMRAYMSRHEFSESTLIAELVLTSISYLFLINSLVDLWEKHETQKHDEQIEGQFGLVNEKTVHLQKKNRWVHYAAWFLRGALIASLASAIAAGAILARQFDDGQKATTIRNLVKASYILSLATTAVSIIGVLVTHFTNHRSKRNTGFLLLYSIPLLIVGIYRVVEVFTGYRATTRQLVAFWVAMVLFELIALCILLSISIPKWFGDFKVKHAMHHDEEKRRESMNTMTTGNGTARY
ncbi:hypothetical protein FFLO_04431 [Filobasidium floriforme]|uniref:Uncharacterized protein n=1 Tax=Filobasidium floriforme TaxID=5210 RepID=A0A8K0JKC8_9TREE|nr:uncharacterized protein HD553DRAFT_339924 [Filobasidium floriforme]KAG7531310.1 hypothetical protein FFLO_04431 [Filobasidium floriforme]KAH8088560.1 hypothetical protein HD553DRAFT_339924 [Filobasidium floriforme]